MPSKHRSGPSSLAACRKVGLLYTYVACACPAFRVRMARLKNPAGLSYDPCALKGQEKTHRTYEDHAFWMDHGSTINSELFESPNHDSDLATKAKQQTLTRVANPSPKKIVSADRNPFQTTTLPHGYHVFGRWSTPFMFSAASQPAHINKVCIINIENISCWAIVFDCCAFWIHLKLTTHMRATP